MSSISWLIVAIVTPILSALAQPTILAHDGEKQLVVGAEQTELYLPLLSGKRVAIVGNQTTIVKENHLVDTLISLKVNIVKVFSPEHGFRGQAGAGEHVASGKDIKTGLPLVSLYGNHKKPTSKDLEDVDFIIFDIQDVGTRFYTYISTLQYVMEAAAENDKALLILDRPNPNGHYVDGPVLQKDQKSFVGMQAIPIAHGMTIGEYALMLNGEKWLKDSVQCDLTVIKVKNYTHQTRYTLPIAPSPNLPNMEAIYLYPSLCLFEGTPISIGRGTDSPFQIYGHPDFKETRYSFTPKSIVGKASSPKLMNTLCHGFDLRNYGKNMGPSFNEINLFWLMDAYTRLGKKESFFKPFFHKLAGTKLLSQQIIEGKSEKEIRESWKQDLENFKKIRRKYLLYKDFQ